MKRYSKTILIVTLLALVSTIKAERVQFGDLFYEIDDETLTAKVTHNFEKNGYGYNYVSLPAHINVPESINVKDKNYTVTAIGTRAFEICEGLTSIELSNSITSLGSCSFAGCGLTSIIIPESVSAIGIEAFQDCYSLTDIKLPQHLETIGKGAFSSTAITSITLPEGLTEIPNYLFSHTSLESITLPSSVVKIGDYAFCWCENLKEINNINNIESIGVNAFGECKNIKSLTLTNIHIIKESAFKDCISLMAVTFGNEELTIGSNAFANCTSLANVSFGNKLIDIEDYAFSECQGLKELNIPESIQRIGQYAFYDCMGLSSVSLNDGSTPLQLGSAPFANSPFTYLYLGRNIQGLKEINHTSAIFSSNKELQNIVIGDSVTSIPRQLFRSSESLQEIWFGKNVKKVFSDAFANCPNVERVGCSSVDNWSKISFEYAESNPLSYGAGLYVDGQLVTDVLLSEDAKAIGSFAFARYTPLRTLEISENVDTIGEYAFIECINLERVSVRPGKKIFEDGAFLRCTEIKDINCFNIQDWVSSEFDSMYSNPITAGTKFYADGELLTIIELPEGIEEIGKNCFSEYDFVTKVSLPESVVKVNNYSFAHCKNLEEVSLGSNLTSLGNRALYCENLKTIISKATTPPSFSTKSTTSSFYDYSATVNVPEGCMEIYRQNECWKKFDDIRETDFSGVDFVEKENSKPFQIDGNILYALNELEIYSLSGMKLTTLKANSSITLSKGKCYVVRCNGKTYKIMA